MKDERVRLAVTTGNGTRYRATAPTSRPPYMNGAIVVERLVKDSLGNESWSKVGDIPRPSVTGELDDPLYLAVYWLLAGEGAR